jgi:hypothetical protein
MVKKLGFMALGVSVFFACPSSPSMAAGHRLFPSSSHAVAGKAYRFSLYTHCGMRWPVVDFDHAFWDLADRHWAQYRSDPNSPPGVGNPFQPGMMTLVDKGHARFDFRYLYGPNAGSPDHMHFARHRGPEILSVFCD